MMQCVPMMKGSICSSVLRSRDDLAPPRLQRGHAGLLGGTVARDPIGIGRRREGREGGARAIFARPAGDLGLIERGREAGGVHEIGQGGAPGLLMRGIDQYAIDIENRATNRPGRIRPGGWHGG